MEKIVCSYNLSKKIADLGLDFNTHYFWVIEKKTGDKVVVKRKLSKLSKYKCPLSTYTERELDVLLSWKDESFCRHRVTSESYSHHRPWESGELYDFVLIEQSGLFTACFKHCFKHYVGYPGYKDYHGKSKSRINAKAKCFINFSRDHSYYGKASIATLRKDSDSYKKISLDLRRSLMTSSCAIEEEIDRDKKRLNNLQAPRNNHLDLTKPPFLHEVEWYEKNIAWLEFFHSLALKVDLGEIEDSDLAKIAEYNLDDEKRIFKEIENKYDAVRGALNFVEKLTNPEI